jgi:DNA (cytosine-5)-methyltransferase 1
MTKYGKYEAAVARWEQVTGFTAPPPTIDGRSGKRLNPAFAEWMMGMPGWVTDVPGVSHTQALKMIGNAVCPQQAALAMDLLWGASSTLNTGSEDA